MIGFVFAIGFFLGGVGMLILLAAIEIEFDFKKNDGFKKGE